MKEDLIKALEKYKEEHSTRVVNNGGLSTLGLLGITLIVLKCLGYLNISWWWVLAPFWIPLGIVIATLAILLLIIIVATFSTNNSVNTDYTSTNTAEVNIPTEESKTVPKPKKRSHKKVKKESNGEETN